MSDTQAAKERRAKQTMNNLILSLLATAALVLIIVLVVPRPTTSLLPHFNYKAAASDAKASSNLPILVPELVAKGWYSNSARWTTQTADGVNNWYVGFVGPKNEYLGFTQAFGSNPTWTMLQLKGDLPTGSKKIDGRTWVNWNSTTVNDPVLTRDHALVTDIQVKNRLDQVLIYGTATKQQFNRFAALISQSIAKAY